MKIAWEESGNKGTGRLIQILHGMKVTSGNIFWTNQPDSNIDQPRNILSRLVNQLFDYKVVLTNKWGLEIA